MKTLLTTICFCLVFAFAKAQKVDILDKNRKVIKTVDEKDLDKEVEKLGKVAQYTGRWIKGKAKECRINWNDLELISV